MQELTLVILAAGMGSRYGGLKQIDSLGANGETIIDYNIYDALTAGFRKIVFVIRKDIKTDFETIVAKKYRGKVKIEYAFQESDCLPDGFCLSVERRKPWGTGHAIWVSKNVVNDVFAVINGDDFYGRNAFKQMANYLLELPKEDTHKAAMIAYRLENTLSKNGFVSRGVCTENEQHLLKTIREHTHIVTENGQIINKPPAEEQTILLPETPVSMNFWGFHPSVFKHLGVLFSDFLSQNAKNAGAEFYIPFAVDVLIQQNKLEVAVLKTDSVWYGVTYQEDRAWVAQKLKELTE